MLSYTKIIPKIKRQFFFFLLGLFLILPLSYELAYFERIYPGIKIAGEEVGNKTKEEAQKLLLEALEKRKGKELIVSSQNRAWAIPVYEIELSYDASKSVDLAYGIGRRGNPFFSLWEKWQAWEKGINLPLEFTYNESLLNQKLEEISSALFVPAIEPQIRIVEKGFLKRPAIAVDPGKNGQEVNLPLLKEEIKKNLSFLSDQPISLPLTYIQPALSPEALENTKKQAEKFLGKRIKVVFKDESFILDEKQLIGLLSPSGNFDQEKIATIVGDFSLRFDKPPKNATFQFSEGKVTVFGMEEEGIKIDQQKTLAQINILLKKISDGESEEETLLLPYEKIPPQIKTSDINGFGIKEQLGKGVSYFRGSISSRIHNLTLASLKLNGLLIPPGEVFSFNQSLGEVSRSTGYREAYIIKEGKTVLGDGGGVCQVSTTLFRAALAAGLPIIERHAHAYRVSYYEQNSPPGIDATVWNPNADLKFKNDTPAYILIQGRIDEKNQELTFEIYGTSDGRVVEMGKPRIWDQTPPPPDLYQDDPTLPVGTIKQVDWKAWGAKVAFDWKVTRGEEILEEQTFYSVYRPWQAVYLRGTKQ